MSAELPSSRNGEAEQNTVRDADCSPVVSVTEDADHGATGSSNANENGGELTHNVANIATVTMDGTATGPMFLPTTPCSDSTHGASAEKVYSRHPSTEGKQENAVAATAATAMAVPDMHPKASLESDEAPPPAHPSSSQTQDSSDSTMDEDPDKVTAAAATSMLPPPEQIRGAQDGAAVALRRNQTSTVPVDESMETVQGIQEVTINEEDGDDVISGSASAAAKASSDVENADDGDNGDVSSQETTTKVTFPDAKALLVTGLSASNSSSTLATRMNSQSPDLSQRILHHANFNCREYIESLQQQLSELQKENTFKQAEVWKYKHENESLKSQVEKNKCALQQVQEEMKTMDERLRVEFNEKTESIVSAVHQAFENRQAADYQWCRELTSKIEHMEIKHSDEVGRLTQRIDAERKEKAQLEQEVRNLQEQIRDLRQKNMRLDKELEVYRAQQLGLSVDQPLPTSDTSDVSTVSSVQETTENRPEPGVSAALRPSDDERRIVEIREIQCTILWKAEECSQYVMQNSLAMLQSVRRQQQCAVLADKKCAPCHYALPPSVADQVDTRHNSSQTATAAALSPGKLCLPCSIGGVIRVPIINRRTATTPIAKRIGLTEEKLGQLHNHICLHYQIAKYYMQGLVAIVPDWDVRSNGISQSRTLRVIVLDEQIMGHSVSLNPECERSCQKAICLDTLPLCMASLHGRHLTVAEQDWPDPDVLAVNIWYVFRKAMEDRQRRLPTLDPTTRQFRPSFSKATLEVVEHVRQLCTELFRTAVGDDQLYKSFVKAMFLADAASLVDEDH
ncbi:uncharacterized protein LOC135823292 [Sycon ciliatum]|uniref:uncharacterized protein LOC135823292 n=1 Tax=Sycon ciliatum TaxID=27933 RepID=UPI0031F712CD